MHHQSTQFKKRVVGIEQIFWGNLCLRDSYIQTCSFHAGEEGVFLVGDGPSWAVAIKHLLQELGIVFFFTLSQSDAFSGLDQLCSYYVEHTQHSKILPKLRLSLDPKWKVLGSQKNNLEVINTMLEVICDEHHTTHFRQSAPSRRSSSSHRMSCVIWFYSGAIQTDYRQGWTDYCALGQCVSP